MPLFEITEKEYEFILNEREENSFYEKEHKIKKSSGRTIVNYLTGEECPIKCPECGKDAMQANRCDFKCGNCDC